MLELASVSVLLDPSRVKIIVSRYSYSTLFNFSKAFLLAGGPTQVTFPVCIVMLCIFSRGASTDLHQHLSPGFAETLSM